MHGNDRNELLRSKLRGIMIAKNTNSRAVPGLTLTKSCIYLPDT